MFKKMPVKEVEKQKSSDESMLSELEEAVAEMMEVSLEQKPQETSEYEILRLPKNRKVRKLESEDEEIKDETSYAPPQAKYD
jgi:hypothetical protein